MPPDPSDWCNCHPFKPFMIREALPSLLDRYDEVEALNRKEAQTQANRKQASQAEAQRLQKAVEYEEEYRDAFREKFGREALPSLTHSNTQHNIHVKAPTIRQDRTASPTASAYSSSKPRSGMKPSIANSVFARDTAGTRLLFTDPLAADPMVTLLQENPTSLENGDYSPTATYNSPDTLQRAITPRICDRASPTRRKTGSMSSGTKSSVRKDQVLGWRHSRQSAFPSLTRTTLGGSRSFIHSSPSCPWFHCSAT
jgi:hypothetical protein